MLSRTWTLRLGAVAVVLLTAPIVLQVVLSGELTVRPGRRSAGDQFAPVVAFVVAAMYLGWSLLMDRLTEW